MGSCRTKGAGWMRGGRKDRNARHGLGKTWHHNCTCFRPYSTPLGICASVSFSSSPTQDSFWVFPKLFLRVSQERTGNLKRKQNPKKHTTPFAMLPQVLLSLIAPLLVLAGDDGGLTGATSSAEAAGYSCDATKCKLPKCACASTSPPGGLSPVSGLLLSVLPFICWALFSARQWLGCFCSPRCACGQGLYLRRPVNGLLL
jgi:hypothetical protein